MGRIVPRGRASTYLSAHVAAIMAAAKGRGEMASVGRVVRQLAVGSHRWLGQEAWDFLADFHVGRGRWELAIISPTAWRPDGLFGTGKVLVPDGVRAYGDYGELLRAKGDQADAFCDLWKKWAVDREERMDLAGVSREESAAVRFDVESRQCLLLAVAAGILWARSQRRLGASSSLLRSGVPAGRNVRFDQDLSPPRSISTWRLLPPIAASAATDPDDEAYQSSAWSLVPCPDEVAELATSMRVDLWRQAARVAHDLEEQAQQRQ